jgi:hypothetical protein
MCKRFIDWLIVGCLTFAGKYSMHTQYEKTLNNIQNFWNFKNLWLSNCKCNDSSEATMKLAFPCTKYPLYKISKRIIFYVQVAWPHYG